MKKIQLNGPALNNAGDYVDAGETLTVGKEAGMISLDRAKPLVDRGAAVVVAEDK